MIFAALTLLGLCLGSFVNALVWRMHQQALPASKRTKKVSSEELSIAKGRSVCTHCGHTLSASDLIPVLSWVSLRGKCRYCKGSISWQYPAIELTTAALFIFSYVAWPEELKGLEIASFGLWLMCLTGLMALLVYDLRWMLLPNRIIFPLYAVAAAFVLVNTGIEQSVQPILGALGGVVVGGGIFYLLFQVSQGSWIGGGDVKLGFLLGAFLLSPLEAAVMLFIASLLGTLLTVPLLASKKLNRKSRIPFGPFLIVGGIITMLYGVDLLDWYTSLFTGV